MSFILDAVAKSEQERQRHEVPGPQVLAMPVSTAPQSRSLLPYIVVGALVLNAALLAAWLQSGRPLLDSPSQLADTGLQTEQVVARENSSVPAAHTAPAARIAPVEITAGADVREPVVANDIAAAVPQSVVPSAGGSAGNSMAEQEKVAVLEVEPEPVQVDPVVTTTGEDTAGWIRIGPDTLSNKAAAGQPAVASQGKQDAGTALRKVSRLSELPVAVRNDLPRVVFSGHLYSSDPSSSMVFVDDGRPVTQGRQIANGLFLHEITPTGVVVEFRGYLIDVGVLQNWTLN
jgi:general secretion pathway protein B